MAEIEVFRITPTIDKCYEHVEATRIEGSWPNTRYFTTNTPRYVGRFIKRVIQRSGDGGSVTDYFEDNNGNEQTVDYSYQGRTCFREVPCLSTNIPSLEELSRKIVKTQDYSNLDKDSYIKELIEKGGRRKKRRSIRSKSKKQKTKNRKQKTKRYKSKK